MSPRKLFKPCLLALSIATTSQLSIAQDNVGEESTVRYPASYFAEWAPVTAQDMMDRIPGLDASGGFGPPRVVSVVAHQVAADSVEARLQDSSGAAVAAVAVVVSVVAIEALKY